jgi:hypothetical protein
MPFVGKTVRDKDVDTWSNSPSGIARQWYRHDDDGGSPAPSGVAISGATGSQYVLTGVDHEKHVRLGKRASNLAGPSPETFSGYLGPVDLLSGWDQSTALGTGSEIYNATQSAFLLLASGQPNSARLRGSVGRASGKRYFEFRFHSGSTAISVVLGIGLVNQNFVTATHFLGTNANAIIWNEAGGVRYNGNTSYATGMPTLTDQKTGAVCVDIDAQRFWIRTHDSNWNNSGSADPETGVGGLVLPFSGTIYPAAQVTVAGGLPSNSISLFLDGDDLAMTPPSGFAPWGKPATSGGIAAITDAETRRVVQNLYFGPRPDPTRRAVYVDLVAALKTAGVWSKLGTLAILAGASRRSGMVDIKNQRVLRIFGAPTFLADRYSKGTGGLNDYLRFEGGLSSQPGYTQNNAHMGVWSRTDLRATDGSPANSHEFGSALAYISNGTGGGVIVRTNTSAADTYTGTPFSGHLCWTRAVSTTALLYRNGTLAQTITRTSAALNTAVVDIHKVPSSTTASSSYADPGVNEIAAAHLGSALTAQEVTDLHAALSTALTSIGAI